MLFNKSKIKYRIEYLIPEVNYSKVLKTDDLLSIENKILSTGNQIAVSNNKEDFKIKKNSDCKYCIYGRICEKGK